MKITQTQGGIFFVDSHCTANIITNVQNVTRWTIIICYGKATARVHSVHAMNADPVRAEP